MRELFLKIFTEIPADENTGISMFSWSHILYLVAILGVVVLAIVEVYCIKKEESRRTKILDIVAILVAVSYISDFFLQPFWHGGTLLENGEIILDKFPFHICIVLCPLILFSRFSKHGQKMKSAVSVVAVVAPLMWLIYPGTALDTDQAFFSYEVFQLFAYHGLVFIYGTLCLAFNESKLNIKKCYEEAILLVGISLWATFGNILYSCEDHDYNWFFLKDPVFGFIPESINPYVVIVVFYLSCLVIYGVYYLVKYLATKKLRRA